MGFYDEIIFRIKAQKHFNLSDKHAGSKITRVNTVHSFLEQN